MELEDVLLDSTCSSTAECVVGNTDLPVMVGRGQEIATINPVLTMGECHVLEQ